MNFMDVIDLKNDEQFYHSFVVWELSCDTKWECEVNVGGF